MRRILSYDEGVDSGECIDHHLSLPLGDDNFIDYSIALCRETGKIELEIVPNFKGEQDLSKEVRVEITRSSANELLQLAGHHDIESTTPAEDKSVTVDECVNWAKDRLIDDVKLELLENPDKPNFAAMNRDDQLEVEKGCQKFARLMAVPHDQIGLEALQKAGYWNGKDDTYFEERPIPSWI